MRPSRAAWLLFALCWLFSGPVVAAGPDFGQAQAVVVRVCDGDTVVVDIPEYPPIIGKAIRVRLAGVNAPELRDPDPAVRRAARADAGRRKPGLPWTGGVPERAHRA